MLSAPCPASNFKTTDGILMKLCLYKDGNEWKSSAQEAYSYPDMYLG